MQENVELKTSESSFQKFDDMSRWLPDWLVSMSGRMSSRIGSLGFRLNESVPRCLCCLGGAFVNSASPSLSWSESVLASFSLLMMSPPAKT